MCIVEHPPTTTIGAGDVLLTATPAQTVIADKAYDAQARLIEPLWAKGKAVVIPSRTKNRQRREYDRERPL